MDLDGNAGTSGTNSMLVGRLYWVNDSAFPDDMFNGKDLDPKSYLSIVRTDFYKIAVWKKTNGVICVDTNPPTGQPIKSDRNRTQFTIEIDSIDYSVKVSANRLLNTIRATYPGHNARIVKIIDYAGHEVRFF